MSNPIAIVGAACRYPDAASPTELWENVLSQRQAFRRIPPERLPLDDYYSPDPAMPDRTYSQNAALITNWTFDRAKYRVSRSTFDSADLAHWLALEVADAALADAGFDPPAGTTGVILGNTLTGDSSRANSLRLRWPYVRRAAINAGASDDVLRRLEEEFNGPLAAVGEDTLSGGLSNTIAGRICNYFGFHGGGYTVDGACSSSLLSVIHACNALVAGDLDVALAGGVDLSLDPFELIGFAKVTALAKERMWVYDKKSNGFLPGEGCGFVVLMRRDDAIRQGRRIYATLLGWGMSSDGHGGMTRPEARGQRLAFQRAYAKAGIPIDSVTLFEGHGTGTPVGDPIEISTVTSLLSDDRPRFIGSVKANIGHTKAAAGIAGMIKAMMAVHTGVIPPITGCSEPRDLAPLQVAQTALPWPENAPRRAAVSAMGFGGINTHVVLEGSSQLAVGSRQWRTAREELFLFGASSREELRATLDAVASRAADLSLAELTDLASALRKNITGRAFRAAFVASTPHDVATAALSGRDAAEGGGTHKRPRIAFLFSGQGSIPNVTTDVAQPAIVRASLERLNELRRLGIEAHCAIGHSLGELTALHWSGALDEQQLLELATFRGNAMQQLAGDGGMAALSCGEDDARALMDDDVVIAAFNGPQQTVVSGPGAAIDRTIERARARGIGATRVPVAAAFHSPMMAPATWPLREYASNLAARGPGRGVFSTVTGDWLRPETSLPDLLATQLTAPVRFREAVEAVAREADLLIEVGPGRVLTNLASFVSVPVVSSDRILDAVAAAWTAGADVDVDALFADRFARPFDLNVKPTFIVSPTESLWTAAAKPPLSPSEAPASLAQVKAAISIAAVQTGTLRELVAKHVDLSLDLVLPTSKLLSDLHLSSITVARLLADAARAMGVPPLADPTSFANATIEEATAALEALRGVEAPPPEPRLPEGVANWLRAFRIEEVPVKIGTHRRASEPDWRILGDYPSDRKPKGRGTIAVLPKDDIDACIDILLQCRDTAGRLVLVQQAPCGSGFARTLFIEKPDVSVRIVNVQRFDADAIIAEAEAHGDFCEATYGEDGVRREPRVVLADVRRAESAPLHSDDVLLVTGGGKGIGFESALHLAKTTGAKLILLGRSREDDELRANLARLDAANVRYEYVVADVTKPLPAFANVTAILHAAGSNAPALLDALDETAFRAAVAPKVDGLLNVLAAVDPNSLKLLITFGSVIARTGMRGEAHYAFANEWLARATEEFGVAHPMCRAICIEYSVWSGMGMGERLGTMDALRRQGITPIAPDDAVRLMAQLAAAPPASHVIACGRLGDPPTIRFADEPLPLYRFLEQPRFSIPGVELVADAELSLRNDPYLTDHAFGGEPLLPAVVGLEAMAQVARTVSGEMPVKIENVELLHPVTLATIRIASLVHDDTVDVAVRSSSTQFHLDHFRARVHVGERPERPRIEIADGHVDLDPARDLYGPLLFHTGRFRGVRRYRRLTATECVAEIAPHNEPLFHRYLPPNLLLGDATIRDAAIHALQACVPQATVLPAGIGSVELFARVEGDAIVVARETARDASGFVYDVDLAAPDGQLFERWHGLRLQIISRRERIDDLAPALWGPFLERELSVTVRVGDAEVPVSHRHDGKPLVARGHISRSHDADVALTVTHETPVGVDVQHVNGEPWDAIIGAHDGGLADVCARISGGDRRFAAARIWSARESMKKLAGDALVPLVVDAAGTHGRVTFRSGAHRIDTFVMRDCVVAVAKERST